MYLSGSEFSGARAWTLSQRSTAGKVREERLIVDDLGCGVPMTMSCVKERVCRDPPCLLD
jgi:hypothetical protein